MKWMGLLVVVLSMSASGSRLAGDRVDPRL